MFSFKPKKAEVEPKFNQDLQIISQMNQEFASSLDLNDTLQTALRVIIERLNAQAANIFLINDKKNEVHVFMDENLKKSEKISFHPNINTKSLRLLWTDFEKYLEWTGNTIEFRKLYD